MTITLWETCAHNGAHLTDLTWAGAAVLLTFFGCGWLFGRTGPHRARRAGRND